MTSLAQTLPNRVGSGAAQRGSTTGIDTNDPLFLTHTGSDHYVRLPGTADNAVFTGPQVVPAGDFTVLVEAKMVDKTAAAQGLAGQYLTGGNHRCWAFRVDGGDIDCYLSPDGSAVTTVSILGFSALIADDQWFSILFNINLDAGGAVITAAVTPEGGSTTVLTSSVAVSMTALNVFQSGANPPVVVGARFHSSGVPALAQDVLNGSVRRVAVNGVDVFRPSAQIDTSGAPNAGQATAGITGGLVTRSTTGLKTAVVTRPVILFDGVDNYVQLPASDTPTFTATTGKHTVVVLARFFPSSVVPQTLWSSRGSTQGGILRIGTGGAASPLVGGTSNSVAIPVGSVLTAGQLFVVGLVVDNGSAYGYRDGSALVGPADITGVGTITHETNSRLGDTANGLGVYPTQSEILACLTFKGSALTETELDTISAQLLAGAYA